ncbi:MAG: YcxB family protein [Clostridiales bacterium]|nr:YcxB family protein [Clostridiales bacterium]
MMEFINCYVINEKIYGDYIKNVLFGQLRRITLISAGIGLMLAFIELIFKGIPMLSGLLMLISATTLLMTEFIGKVTLKNMRKYHGGEMPETRITFDDDIRTEEGTHTNAIEYAKITHIHNLKNTYVLQCGKALFVIVAKGKFTVGDEAEFCSFLKDKCPEAKFIE